MQKSIPTKYKDTLYRSELEARTAYVLDNLNIKFEYETITFEVHSKGNRITKSYTPDFFLPDAKVIIEMKGDYDKRSKENTDIVRRFMNQCFRGYEYRDENDYLQKGNSLIKILNNGFFVDSTDFTYFVIDSDFYIIDYISNEYTPFYNLNTYIPYAIKEFHAYVDKVLLPYTDRVENNESWECLKFSTPTQLTDYLNQNSVKKDDVLLTTSNSNNITIVKKVCKFTQELFHSFGSICKEDVEYYLSIGITQFIAEFYIKNIILKRLKDLVLKSYTIQKNSDHSKYTDKFNEVITVNEHISLVYKPVLEFKDSEYTNTIGEKVINDKDSTFNVIGCTLSYKEHSINMKKIKFGEEITFSIEEVYKLIDYIKKDYIELIKGLRK